MTIDPAFGLVIALPLALLAIAAAVAARPGRRRAAVMSGCAALAFVVGCGKTQNTSEAPSTQPSAAIAPAPKAAVVHSTFSAAAAGAARNAKPGKISVDVLDSRADGAQHANGLTLSSGQTLHAIGWAYLSDRHERCSAVGLIVDGSHIYPGEYGYTRSDVATFYHDPAMTDVGYEIVVPAARLHRGAHRADVVCVGPDGDAIKNFGDLRIDVR